MINIILSSLATYIFSGFALTAQWKKEGIVSFNTSKSKLLILQPYRAFTIVSPVFMEVCTINEALNFYSELYLLMCNSYIWTISKGVENNFVFLYRFRKYLTFHNSLSFKSVKLEQKLIIGAISGLNLLSSHFPALSEFKVVYVSLWMIKYFSTVKFLSHRRNFRSLSIMYRSSRRATFLNATSLKQGIAKSRPQNRLIRISFVYHL